MGEGVINISVITGSRADYGHLEWLIKLMREDAFFGVAEIRIWGQTAPQAMHAVTEYLAEAQPDLVLLLGDRFEIMAAAMAAHLQRIRIAHLCGGDITEGSYDDAMRDCISRMAYVHFPATYGSASRLINLGYQNVHAVGATAHDYILNAPWKKERPIEEPYVVVSYQPETIDKDFGAGTEIGRAFADISTETKRVFIRPNKDRGSDLVNDIINGYEMVRDVIYDALPHDEFLNLIAHCEEFIGNSSALYYEAPILGIKTREIGKRQRGRKAPLRGDGKASERIIAVLKTL